VRWGRTLTSIDTTQNVENPFDFSQFQAAKSGGLQPVAIPVTQVDIRVPGKTEWIRVHKEVTPFPARLVYPPDVPNAQGEKPPKEAPLAANNVALNPTEYEEVDLVPYVNREGGFGLWPIKRNPASSMGAAYANKNREIAQAAQDAWVKRVSKSGDLPSMEVAANQGYEPQWPSDFDEETFLKKYLGMAFPGRLIASEGHALVRKHRGE
jgi:hypothetical protein